MQRHLTFSLLTSILLLSAGPALAVNIGFETLSITEYDQGTLTGEQFEAEVFFPTGNFTGGTYSLTDPAAAGSLIFEGTEGGEDLYFLDELFGATVGSDLSILLTGGAGASLTIAQDVGLLGGLPVLSSFNVVGELPDRELGLHVLRRGHELRQANILGISAFDVATDGDIFDGFSIINTPQGTSGQAIIDLTGAAPGSYEIELEFFSNRDIADALSDPGNVWTGSSGRSALNGGFAFTVAPEPSTGLLVGLGLIGIAGRRRARA